MTDRELKQRVENALELEPCHSPPFGEKFPHGLGTISSKRS
jgi:hypothetical protein